MGILNSSLAVAGAIGGAGKGIEDVAKEDLQKQRTEALIRLKEQYENQRQQTGIEAQKSLQASQQTFQAGETQKHLTAASTAHGLTLAQEERLKNKELASQEARTERSAEARENSAIFRGATAGANKGATPWSITKVNGGYPLMDDPNHPGRQIPNITAQPTQNVAIMNRKTGRVYAPQGDRLYQWDNNKQGPIIDPKGTNRSADPYEIQDLLKDPTGVIPPGYKNAGQTKADAFESAHGYLPAQFQDAVMRAQDTQGGQSIKLPMMGGRTRTVQLPQGNAGAGEEPPESAEDTADAGGSGAASHADADFAGVANTQ